MSKRPASPTPNENFLFYLTELERLVEGDVIKWDAPAALAAQHRLDRLAAVVRRIAAEIRGH